MSCAVIIFLEYLEPVYDLEIGVKRLKKDICMVIKSID
jgi:hypothetical protein